jgi:tetratricopeptide (TPR) repeat protein
MHSSPYIICLWPGLPRLWIRGDWVALAIAVTFGAALNLVLVSSFIWPELLPPSFNLIGWLILGTVWLASVLQAYRSLPHLREPPRVDDRGLFIQAQAEYLKGHWFEAETLLRQLLRYCSRDVDVLLMLATLYRRTGRYDEAAKQLDRLDRLDESPKWCWEIAQERETLKRRPASKTNKENTGTDSGTDTSNEELDNSVPQLTQRLN